ncbi:hypothetical protein [uncultured Albimonas sp.]|uniref:hypothetical protein n=1 Tax=uncultured Albimonas sp. TaxID=1331701 RepID=UPI0030EE92FA|tara:strand:- start:4822 stop:5322 length:501 start_codon:yes stop_codon:yes gene_type:complete
MAEPVALRPCPACWQASVPAALAATAPRLLAEALGAPPPAPGATLSTPEGLLWRAAPRAWRLLGEGHGAPAPAALALPGAALTDLGPGLSILSLRGPLAGDLAARAVPLDLRAAAFPPGAVAATVHRHAGVTLFRREGGFDLLVPRSLGADFAARLERIAGMLAAG